MKEFWQRVKIGLFVILALLILAPAILYLTSLDWSRSHTARVNALPELSHIDDRGEYRLRANGLEFLVRVAGMQNEGEPIILLHGFPESSIVWQSILDSAAENGHRALAFDQRGYSPNARPEGVKNYEIQHLVKDVISVADQVGFDTFHLVGHDWGSGVGWKTVMEHPQRIHTWTAMSIPHIGAFFDGLLNDPEQQKRSDYMNKLRKPVLPELFIQVFKKRIFRGLEGRWHPHEIAEYIAIHSEHGASTGPLNWYRAMDYHNMNLQRSLDKKVNRPTLFIYGKHDPVVSSYVVEKQAEYMDAPLESIKMDIGHSVVQEGGEEVINAILDHWSRPY